MAKAILVIDMPSSCKECPFIEFHCDGLYCIPTIIKKLNRNWNKERQEWCPLREVQKKQEVYTTNQLIKAYVDGYNKCIDEILGGAE